ncbi:hypothetical protein XENTR_v10003781 [Xenopus tropicalis]|nr:hypothetical protein XENTR_v10003781 [Xenopus tropicalis]
MGTGRQIRRVVVRKCMQSGWEKERKAGRECWHWKVESTARRWQSGQAQVEGGRERMGTGRQGKAELGLG